MEQHDPIEKCGDKDIMDMVNDIDNITFIAPMGIRIGSHLFYSKLEYTHFIPDTDANALYKMAVVNWQDLKWGLVSIPKAELVARECGIVFEPEKCPYINLIPFPYFNVSTCVSLSNTPGHPVYSKGDHEKMLKEEYDECQKIYQTFEDAQQTRQ